MQRGVGKHSEQCDGPNGDVFDVFCLKQSCLDLVVSSPALKKQGKVDNGRKWNGEEQGGRREGASTYQRKVGKPGGSTWNFHPPCLAAFATVLPLAVICSQTSSLISPLSYQTPPHFLLSPLCLGMLSTKLYKTLSALLQISLSNLAFAWGLQILADYQAFGGGHVCTHVCALKEKGLFLAWNLWCLFWACYLQSLPVSACCVWALQLYCEHLCAWTGV